MGLYDPLSLNYHHSCGAERSGPQSSLALKNFAQEKTYDRSYFKTLREREDVRRKVCGIVRTPGPFGPTGALKADLQDLRPQAASVGGAASETEWCLYSMTVACRY